MARETVAVGVFTDPKTGEKKIAEFDGDTWTCQWSSLLAKYLNAVTHTSEHQFSAVDWFGPAHHAVEQMDGEFRFVGGAEGPETPEGYDQYDIIH